MNSSANSFAPARASSRMRYLQRALSSAALGVGIALCIAVWRPEHFRETLTHSVSIALGCWFFIDIGRHLIAEHVRQGCSRPGWPGWGWMTGIVIVGSYLGFLSGTTLADLITGQRTHPLSGNDDARRVFANLLFVALPAAAITYFFNTRGLIADREAAAEVAQRQAAESRLRLLEAQLEPHMFFNTLANLHVLIGLDPPRAQAMLDQLISFLRATLSGSQTAEHPLEAEFSRTRDYLALMQVRMEDRLQIRFELPENLADVPVPPLLLQPLVENSIKHGLEPSVAGGRIDVIAAQEDGTLVLTVRDTGIGLRSGTAKGTSFGLRQVRERLDTVYGKSSSLQLRGAEDGAGGVLAVIRLPIQTPRVLS